MPIDRNSAQYITGALYKPTQTSAPGVWDLDDQANNIAKNLWPLPPQAVQRSLRFNSADSAYLNRTPASAGNRRTWTWSGWIKRSTISTDTDIFGLRIDGNNQFRFYFNSSDKLDIYNQISATIAARIITTQVFRDVSSWYNIVLAIDTTNGTPGDRLRLYVNGIEIINFDTDTQPSVNYDTQINTTNAHLLGYFGAASFNGYMSEINFVDGQQLTAASFGETDQQTGVWIPKRYTGTYGTNGFRLSFANNSNTTALGYDSSGQGNNWTPNNFSVTPGAGNDSLLDVPSLYGTDTGLGGEVRGNYCTGNYLNSSDPGYTTDGALRWLVDNTRVATGTFGMQEGKWYCEGTVFAIVSTLEIGIIVSTVSWYNNFNSPGAYAGGYTYLSGGNKYNNNSSTTYAASYTTNDVIGIAFDADNRTITFYKNGVSQGTAFTAITAGTYFICARATGIGSGGFTMNFGQRPFAYAAPLGFKALCTTNLPAPAIGQTSNNQADNHFDVLTYVGNGSARSITGLSFQPDLVWIKQRTGATTAHSIQDSVRGVDKHLTSNGTDIEANSAAYGGGVTAFNANGFSIGTWGAVNENTQSYVAWCWNAGGTTVTNSAGTNNASVTSTYRANRAAGFSIVSWTYNGTATIAHGLNAVPKFMIIRGRNAVYNWDVYHASIGPTVRLVLNSTSGSQTYSGPFNNTTPTSSVFSQGAAWYNNGDSLIGYIFAEIPGYSAFGSYTGNGSTDGPFIYLGFRPAWIMIKRSDAIENWNLYDNKRNPYNVADLELYPNLSNSEGTTADRDFLSNGFKIRSSNAGRNASGGTYIYAAFAETPARLSSAR